MGFTYEYRCKFHGSFDVYKHVNRSQITEQCPICRSLARRVFTPHHVSMGTFKPGYYPTFGATMRNKRDLNNALAKYKHDTGSEAIEVGNDKSVSKREYKMPDRGEVEREYRRLCRRS